MFDAAFESPFMDDEGFEHASRLPEEELSQDPADWLANGARAERHRRAAEAAAARARDVEIHRRREQIERIVEPCARPRTPASARELLQRVIGAADASHVEHARLALRLLEGFETAERRVQGERIDGMLRLFLKSSGNTNQDWIDAHRVIVRMRRDYLACDD